MSKKCSGPRVDPPHSSYSNSLDSLPAAFASFHPCRRLSLGHICSSFLHRVHRLWCTVRLVYHPSHLAALLVLACLGLSSPCSPSLSLPPSFSLSRYSILYIHGISYLCLAFAVKPVIVQLQRHSRLYRVEGIRPLDSGDIARCQDLTPAFTRAPFPLDALGATWRTIQMSTCDHPRLLYWVLVCLELVARVYLAKI